MSKTFPSSKKAIPEPKATVERHSSYQLSVTGIFWIIIALLIFIISLSAALMVEWWGRVPETPSAPLPAISQPTGTSAQSPQTPSSENATPAPLPAASVTWKQLAQQLQQSEQIKSEVLANALKKLPELAPLPRPQAIEPPAPPKVAPVVSWKIMSLELESVEKQQGEMLRKLLEKMK